MHTAEGRAERIRSVVAASSHYQEEGRIARIQGRGPEGFTVQLYWGQPIRHVAYQDVPDCALFYTEDDYRKMRS